MQAAYCRGFQRGERAALSRVVAPSISPSITIARRAHHAHTVPGAPSSPCIGKARALCSRRDGCLLTDVPHHRCSSLLARYDARARMHLGGYIFGASLMTLVC